MENERSRKRHKPSMKSEISTGHNESKTQEGTGQERKDSKQDEISGGKDKKQSYVCGDCGYVASRNVNLKLHRSMAHRRLKVLPVASVDLPRLPPH